MFKTPAGASPLRGLGVKPQHMMLPGWHSSECHAGALYVGGFTPNPLSGDAPRGRSVEYSENYTLPSERKTYTNTL